jgi:PAS domain S-box-containing protein
MGDALTLDQAARRQPRPHDILAALTRDSNDGVWVVDRAGALLFMNPAAEQLLGWPEAALVGRPIHDVIHVPHAEAACPLLGALRSGRDVTVDADLFTRQDGAVLPVSFTSSPILTGSQVTGAVVTFRDCTARNRAEEELAARVRQQAAVAELGQRALAGPDLATLMNEAVALVARTLGVEYGTVLELLPDDTALRLRAGVGWQEGLVGQAIVELDSQAGYSLGSGEPVIVHDLHTERRFRDSPLLREHGVVSGMSVIIPGQERPFGVLGAHTTRRRLFTADDVHFLQAVANVLAAAIERKGTEKHLQEREAQYRSIFEATTDGLVIIDLNGAIVEVNPAYCAMFGYSYDELIGMPYNALFHPDSLRDAADAFAAVQSGGAARAHALMVRKDGTLVHVEGYGAAFTYRGMPHLLGIARDITERVQAYEVLEQRVAERTRELSALLEVSHNVASTLELAPLLGLILEQLKTVVDNTGAAIFTAEGEYLRLLDYRGPLPREQMVGRRFPLDQAPSYQEILRNGGRPTIVDDVWGDSPLAQAYQRSANTPQDPSYQYIRSLLVVPLKVKERLIGVVRIDHSAPHAYTPQHAMLVLAFANQAAVAIENARLYARAQDMAALEERQRLARELHDSVTQALYGVTLYAEAAGRLLAAGERDGATTYLREVRDTAQEALQEMRLLIFELRPPILEQEGLVAALQARLAAVEGRMPGLVTTVDAQSDLRLPAPIEEALYRIAQETLNNVFKHAKAHTIALSLRQQESAVTLEIADDGAGFDRATAERQGGFGLRGIAERAAHVGGAVTVQSAPGQGTVVRVEVTL